MRTYTRAENEISKEQFPRVSRRGLHRGKEIYKLKSGLTIDIRHFFIRVRAFLGILGVSFQPPFLVANRFSGHFQIDAYFFKIQLNFALNCKLQ